MERTPPALSGVLETVVYFTDQERAETFYSGVLGMRLLDREPSRRTRLVAAGLFALGLTLVGGCSSSPGPSSHFLSNSSKFSAQGTITS